MASSSSAAVPRPEHPPALESDLPIWFSWARSAVKIPAVNSQVYYFVQGHAEQASAAGIHVDLEMIKAVPHRVLCRVIAVEYGADYHTDEVYAKIVLKPVDEPIENDATFVKNAVCERATIILTAKDVYTRTMDVTRKVDEMIPLTGNDATREFTCQDLHGTSYIFKRTRTQLTNGCGMLMALRQLDVNDVVSFMRGANGKIIVAIWRAKPTLKKFAGADFVVTAAMLAASGKAFTVYYYPRVHAPEFVVNAACVDASIHRISRHVRIDMMVDFRETIRLFRGTVVFTEAPPHPQQWPDSPWRRLLIRVVVLAPQFAQLPYYIRCIAATQYIRYMRISAWMVRVTNIQVPEDSPNQPVQANENDPSGSGSNPTTAQVFTFNDKPSL